MRLFISHANADLPQAQVLRVGLDELSSDLDCFLLADDLFAGDDWEARIRCAAEECDGVLSLVTTRYVQRPWFVAEWAMFWFQQKPWYLVVDDVDLPNIFEPMRRRQASRIDDRRSMEQLLRAMPVDLAGSRPLSSAAAELVRAMQEAKGIATAGRLEANLTKLSVSLRRGTDDVSECVVQEIVAAGGVDQVELLGLQSDNSVALRQLCDLLLGHTEFETVTRLVDRIPNNAEKRSVGVTALKLFAGDQASRGFLEVARGIYSSVRDPQRRDLRQAANRLSLVVEWPDVDANP